MSIKLAKWALFLIGLVEITLSIQIYQYANQITNSSIDAAVARLVYGVFALVVLTIGIVALVVVWKERKS